MNKNFFTINKRIIMLFSLLLFLTSCKNLPGKETVSGINNNGNNGETSNNSNLQNNTDETISRPRTSSQAVWTEPQTGEPTVTPIILGVEKRGEAGSIIIRPDSPSNDTINDTYNVQPVSSIPTALPVANQGGMKDAMEVAGFNPVNGATVLPGEAIHLDVTLRNSGTTTWQTNYKIIDISNVAMAVTKEYNLPYPVAPGGTALISIYLAAPAQQGNYPENFQIQDSYGNVFGRFDYILSVGDHSYVTPIATLTATITPTYYSPDGITATPDSLAWMCIDPERSKLQDCYSFCVEFSDREEFKYCFYDGVMYQTPQP
ncbi:MAG: hypothetical protein II969_00215 [Anaerolineaceae bacterium]|nr:hypothetical protein [Anaerolineaceae bacterium]